jgi:Kef-type K+ transport system membrane component KefB
MSYEERSTWTYAALALVIPVVYFAVVLRRLRDTAAAEVSYVTPMLIAIGTAVVLSILGSIVTAVIWPREAGLKDERDTQINHFGEYVGFYVMSVGALVPLGLAMADIDQFWIANSLYLAFVLSALVSSIVKLVAYHRGY